MDPRDIEALHRTLAAGIHRPGSEWRRQDEARRLGRAYIPADRNTPEKVRAWKHAVHLCAEMAAIRNKGVG